jgi:hypothetical protein
LDRFSDPGDFMRLKVIHEDDVARLQMYKYLFDLTFRCRRGGCPPGRKCQTPPLMRLGLGFVFRALGRTATEHSCTKFLRCRHEAAIRVSLEC